MALELMMRRGTVHPKAALELHYGDERTITTTVTTPGTTISDGVKQNDTKLYIYSTSPRALYHNRKMTIGGGGTADYVPPKICKGSNYAMQRSHKGDGESAAVRAAIARNKAFSKNKAKKHEVRLAELRLRSPPPLKGRKHEPVQTDKYLEEIFDNPPVSDMCTQTDLFLERPISPYHVPKKTGIDVETQIWPGDLFDFDMEVQPILEVLVGKTIEQALIEVLEEEELATLKEQQRRFLEIRATELSEVQRLHEKEKRYMEEKERRLKEFAEGALIQKQLSERIAAAVLTQGYIADLLPSILEELESQKFLIDTNKQDIDEMFIPWLMKEVSIELDENVSSRDLLIDIVREILENRAEIYHALDKETMEIPDIGGEEGGYMDDADIALKEHIKLQEEIIQTQQNNLPK